MRSTGLYCLNALLWPALVFLGAAHLCLFGPLFFTVFLATRRGDLHDAARVYAWLTGRFYTRVLSPVVRFRATGLENIPERGPCLFVLNHRAWVDVLCASLQPHANAAVAVRAWPFRIPVVGTFMRLAQFIPVEDRSFDVVARRVARLSRQGVSLVFFPEGHRSRTGRLQRFRSGAFVVANRCRLPIVPVCIEGSERVAPVGSRLLRPGRVEIRILPPILPDGANTPEGHLTLRRRTRQAFEKRLGRRTSSEVDSQQSGDEGLRAGETAQVT